MFGHSGELPTYTSSRLVSDIRFPYYLRIYGDICLNGIIVTLPQSAQNHTFDPVVPPKNPSWIGMFTILSDLQNLHRGISMSVLAVSLSDPITKIIPLSFGYGNYLGHVLFFKLLLSYVLCKHLKDFLL
jgi:hypothetical protein